MNYTKKWTTEIYMHNETADVDTKQGWIDSISGDVEEVERCIENGVLDNMCDDALASLIYEKCSNKFEPCNHTMDDGTLAPLAFGCSIQMSDLCYGSIGGEDIDYSVIVVFSEDQVKEAENDDGVIEDWGELDWSKPMDVIIKEV